MLWRAMEGGRECPHGYERPNYCQDCNPGVASALGESRRTTEEAFPSRMCPHGYARRGYCSRCPRAAICPHGKAQKASCRKCPGKPCPHGRRRARQCVVCRPDLECPHTGGLRSNCSVCTPRLKHRYRAGDVVVIPAADATPGGDRDAFGDSFRGKEAGGERQWPVPTLIALPLSTAGEVMAAAAALVRLSRNLSSV